MIKVHFAVGRAGGGSNRVGGGGIPVVVTMAIRSGGALVLEAVRCNLKVGWFPASCG